MAVVSVSFDGTVISEAESESDNGVWDKFQVTQSPVQELATVFQKGASNAAISNQVSNGTGGVEFEDNATVDFSTTPRCVLAKVTFTNPGILDYTLAEAFSYYIGQGVNGGTWWYKYYLAGLYAGEYPLMRSWLMVMIDPNEVAFRDGVSGTAALTTVDWYGLYGDAAAAAKTDNLVHDRLDYLPIGKGLTLVGGDGASADGTLLDFMAQDFDTEANRYGVIIPGFAEYIVNGVLTVGSATATVYNDTGRVVVFPSQRVGEGALGMAIGMANASNDINFTGYNYIGLGKAAVKKYFDTALEVNATTDVVTIPNHGLDTGDLVTYSNEGGVDNIGLTTATDYFVRAVSTDTVAFYAIGATVGRQNSYTDTSRLALTVASAPGENHSIIRTPDNRFDYTVTGTTGVGHTENSSTIDGARVVTFTSKSTMTGGFIKNTGNVTLGGGTLSGVSLSDATLEEGDAYVDTSDLDIITGCTFTASSEGHAVRMTAATSEGWDNTLSGYWSPAANGWKFSTAQAFTSEQINFDANHGFTTGDAVYYNDEGGIQTIGLTDGNKYYVNVVNVSTVTVHLTRAAATAGSSAINLTTSGSETHSLYSSKAAVFNDTSSGTLTIGVTAGDAPSFRNAPGATTVVNVSVPVTFEAADKSDNAIQSVRITAYLVSDDTEVINTTTNASGIASTTFSGTTPADIYYRYRKSSTGAQKYVNLSGLATIESGTGVSVKRNMTEDNTADPSI